MYEIGMLAGVVKLPTTPEFVHCDEFVKVMAVEPTP